MLNQRKLLGFLVSSLLFVMVVTIVAADDTTLTTEAAYGTEGIALCMEETELQEGTPLGDVSALHLEPETEEEKAAAEAEAEETEETEETDADGAEPAAESEEGSERTEKSKPVVLESMDLWMQAYEEWMYGEPTPEKLAARALMEIRIQEAALKSCETDHIVNYHGTKYAISEEEYQVLLKIVEAEAPSEDIEGRMLVANVVLNRVHAKQFPNTITEVVFQKDQFAPVSDGMYYKRVVSEETIEAVERVLAGEDNSQGALYFVARALASEEGLRFFDEKLEKLFKHGVHTFYVEK